ncbi:MAG TPA: CoA-binding protein [Longimicrobiales bacterium]|nr:CoA-binding protein [Longimicrobiales bacterium]
MADWRKNLVESEAEVRAILEETRRVAVLGIKPETHGGKPAHYVARYLQDVGYEMVPVPVYYPDVTEILGEPVYREVNAVPGEVDMVDVFRRPNDIPPHVDDLIAKQPKVVWFQLGIRNDEAAERLARAGIRVVQDRCTMADHRRFGLGRG